MKILYLTSHLNRGGITSYIYGLAVQMKQKGHEVWVAASGGETEKDFLAAGIGLVKIPVRTKFEANPLRITASVWKLSPLLKGGLDIVHSNTRVTQVIGAFLKRGNPRLRHVTTCHGFFRPRLIRRLFPCWGDMAIAISNSVRKHLICDFKALPERTQMIYNGIVCEKFSGREKTAERDKLGLPPGPLIGIIARLSDVKGHAGLINAFKSVQNDYPAARLLIAGKGPLEKGLKAQVNALGLQDKVVFMPECADLAGILASLDIFVMPSLMEGLGLSLIEAMAAGVPVIGSAVGGISEVILHGYNGLLVEPADHAELACAIKELLGDRTRARQLGVNGRQTAREKFNLKSMADQTERLYCVCLEKH